jgi:hypothetical protein
MAGVPFEGIELPALEFPLFGEVSEKDRAAVEYLKQNDFLLEARLEFVSQRLGTLRGRAVGPLPELQDWLVTIAM